MSTRKKRSLSNVKVQTGDDESQSITEKIVPAVSNFISKKKDSIGQAVRGMEFLVDTERCKPWMFHNRDEVWLNPERCNDLISSIRKNGQQFPIIARKLDNDPDGKAWEIIAGRRRWYACNYLKKQVRVKAFNGDDRECAILMNLENKDRDDISEFEDAVSYRQQLEAGLFDSQDEMAVALDLKKSKLSKLLSASRVVNYKSIMNLFSDVTKLKINPLYNLVSLIERSDENRDIILKRASNIYENHIKKGKKLSTTVCINELIKSIHSSAKGASKKTKTYKLQSTEVLRSEYNSRGDIIFSFKNKNINKNNIKEVKELVLSAMSEMFDTPVS